MHCCMDKSHRNTVYIFSPKIAWFPHIDVFSTNRDKITSCLVSVKIFQIRIKKDEIHQRNDRMDKLPNAELINKRYGGKDGENKEENG